MQKKILRRGQQATSADYLPEVHPLLKKIYAARSIQSNHELNLDINHLLPYQSLSGIEEATLLLATAVMLNQKILVVGDFDADGATSTALAIRALKSFGATKVQFLVPNRFAFGYGLTPELVAVSQAFSPDVLITVDNGIANHAGVAAAKQQNIKVVITDHHLPAATLPDADAIVNPNQVGDTFPSKHLAGVGVIFYVMLALRRYLVQQNWFAKKGIPEPNMSKLLSLVALGTVADVVQLDHNNRILVHQGLRRIRAGQCPPGILALLEIANRDLMRVQAADLGFAVGARLNAAGRIDDMSLGIECLLTDDPMQAREMAQRLNHLNEERKLIERDMQNQALADLQKLHLDAKGELPKGVCLFDESWHQGVIGILAARIKDKFNRPVIVFAPGQTGELKGSARSIHSLHIRDTLARMAAQYPELIIKFGGHAMAAGLSIAKENLHEFAKLFDQTVSQQLSDEELKHALLTDGELQTDEFNLTVAALLQNAGPWGQAFPEPLFDNEFRILEQRVVGEKHLKLRLAKEDKLLEAIAFFVDTKIWPNHRCQTVRAAYRLDVNEYKGQQNVQLIIDYLEPIETR